MEGRRLSSATSPVGTDKVESRFAVNLLVNVTTDARIGQSPGRLLQAITEGTLLHFALALDTKDHTLPKTGRAISGDLAKPLTG